jgi:hypothetical protein
MMLGEFLAEELDLGDEFRPFLPDSPLQFLIFLDQFEGEQTLGQPQAFRDPFSEE